MEKFPVTSSILSSEHVGLFVAKQYGLAANVSCTLLKAGINHSYLVTQSESKFLFRLYSLNWRSDLEINEEIRLLNILSDEGISVSYPIKDSDNKYIQYLQAPEGVRQGLLFSFAEGDKQISLPADLHNKIGQTMARIHQATINLQLERITYSPKIVLEDSLVQLRRFLPDDSNEMHWMVSAKQYLLSEINKVDYTQIRSGAIHLDIWFDNMNVSKEGKITIFDFDFCGNGWLCYDIAYYILQLHSTEKNVNDRDLKIESFLRGYESITQLSSEERRILPVLGVSLYFFYLGIQCQRYENWSNIFLNETYLKRFINLLVRKYFEENVRNQSILN
jgi:Ser/Thr protein kinase RdoA (MazF antagonist)